MSLLMFSLQRFVSRGDRFFDLLEASAEEARHSSRALMELIEHPDADQSLKEFVLRRKEDKRIHEEIAKLLCNTFVTPMDREDIDALSSVLSRIPKVIKKFAERLFMLRRHVNVELFRKQIELLQQATDTLARMVGMLRHQPQLDKIQEENDRLHRFEGDADKLILQLFGDLYNGQYEALQMIVLRDLYELLEKVIDRCRDAGNEIFQIVLKYS
jgi:uncharacterized protein Yka (UPF0111/DUF47 family)